MFQIKSYNPISWVLKNEYEGNILVHLDQFYLAKNFTVNFLKSINASYKIEEDINIETIHYNFKEWVNISSMEFYEELFRQFKFDIDENHGNIEFFIKKLDLRIPKHLFLKDCINKRIFSSNEKYIGLIQFCAIDLPMAYIYTLNADIAVKYRKIQLEFERIKCEFINHRIATIIKLQEIEPGLELNSAICNSATLIYQLDINKSLSIFDKFHIYYRFFLNSKKTGVNAPSFFTNNFQSFKNKYYQYVKQGLKILIHGNVRNQNASLKLNQKELFKIKELYSNGVKWSYRSITREVNTGRILEGKTLLSKNSIISIIKSGDDYLSLYLNRYGKEALDEFLPYPRRKQPNLPGTVVQMDGTRLNFMIKNLDESVSFYNIIAAIDVYSKKILAFRIEKNETFISYFDIIKQIVETNNFLPSEIVLDNLTSLKSGKATVFVEKLEKIGVKVRFHQKFNPQDKSQIENWFKIFNKNYLKGVPGFLGDGIKSTDKDARPKLELLKQYRNPKNIETLETIMSIVKDKIDLYNSTYFVKDKVRFTPNYYFNNKEEKKVITINNEYFFYLFFHEKKVILDKSYINIQENGQFHEYIFYDEHYEFIKLFFGKTIWIRYNILNMNDLYIYSNKNILTASIVLKKHVNVPLASSERSKQDVKNSSIHQIKKKNLVNLLNTDIQNLVKSFETEQINHRKRGNGVGENKSVIKVIPLDLINEKIDSKELINNSVEKSLSNDSNIEILTNMKFFFKVNGSNNVIN